MVKKVAIRIGLAIICVPVLLLLIVCTFTFVERNLHGPAGTPNDLLITYECENWSEIVIVYDYLRKEDVVICLDSVATTFVSLTKNKRLHFAFAGDSRMRHQYFSFVAMLPDSDLIHEHAYKYKRAMHEDVNVTSHLLNLLVSFHWRPLIDAQFMDTIRHWVDHPTPPTVVIVSAATHHMLKIFGADYRLFEERLLQLRPLLSRLANTSRVIWIDQYPTIDFFAANHATNAQIESNKIHHYNLIAKRIFQDTAINYWDVSSIVAREYIRACKLLKRQEPIWAEVPNTYRLDYYGCGDYIHVGAVVSILSTHMLFNLICTNHNTQLDELYNNTNLN